MRPFFAILIGASFTFAHPVEAQAPKRLLPAEIAASTVKTPLSTPSPGEFFAALAKQAKPRWRQVYREPVSESLADRETAAIALGTFAADLHIAAEARGARKIRELIVDIRVLEKILGTSEKSAARLGRVGDLADAQSWAATGVEVEALLREQQALLVQQRDDGLAALLPIGQWIRALHVSALLARELETPDPDFCVGSLALVDSVLRRLDALPKATERHRTVKAARRAIKAVKDSWEGAVAGKIDKVKAAAAAEAALAEFMEVLEK